MFEPAVRRRRDLAGTSYELAESHSLERFQNSAIKDHCESRSRPCDPVPSLFLPSLSHMVLHMSVIALYEPA